MRTGVALDYSVQPDPSSFANGFFAGVARARWTPPVFTAAGIALWVLLASSLGAGQFADNMEQFVWAQSLETSYWKHPPLPSWILWAAINFFGFWSGWTYVLSAACLAGTAFFTWRIAYRLIGPRGAAVAVLLQGLHLGFSQRAELYNHNTVLVLFSAMTVWGVLRALDQRRIHDWMLAGIFAGLAMLAKYQAVVLLSGILVALAVSGDLKARATRRGCMWAVLAGLLVLAPHFVGLLWSDQSNPVGYAMSRVHETGWTTVFASAVSFLLSQVRFHLPVIAAIGLAMLASRKRPAPSSEDSFPAPMAPARVRAWMIGLVLWPAAFLMLVPLASGMLLQAQWGLPAYQFFVIFLGAVIARARPGLSAAVMCSAVIWVQLVSGLIFVAMPAPADRRVDTAFPGREVAQAALQDWKRRTGCPLKFVVGPSFEAGFVSIHAGNYPQVLEDGDFRKSPWINPGALWREGFIAMQRNSAPALSGQRHLVLGDAGPPADLSWTIVPPRKECEPRSLDSPNGSSGDRF